MIKPSLFRMTFSLSSARGSIFKGICHGLQLLHMKIRLHAGGADETAASVPIHCIYIGAVVGEGCLCTNRSMHIQ